MDLKGTVIIYDEEVNKTTIQTNNPKDIKKPRNLILDNFIFYLIKSISYNSSNSTLALYSNTAHAR